MNNARLLISAMERTGSTLVPFVWKITCLSIRKLLATKTTSATRVVFLLTLSLIVMQPRRKTITQLVKFAKPGLILTSLMTKIEFVFSFSQHSVRIL